jgi:hypothetical protein
MTRQRSKRAREEMGDHNHEMMVNSILMKREECPTQFVAPDEDQKWRARNVLTIHWKLTGIECPWEASFVRIMASVIDHANPMNGRCDASQRVIAIETGYSRQWVNKVLKWAVDTQLLQIESRGRRRFGQFKTNAFHIPWRAWEKLWLKIAEHIKAEKARPARHHDDAISPPCQLNIPGCDPHSREVGADLAEESERHHADHDHAPGEKDAGEAPHEDAEGGDLVEIEGLEGEHGGRRGDEGRHEIDDVAVHPLTLNISEVDGEAEHGDEQELDDTHRARHHARRQEIETGPAPDLGELRPRHAAPLDERRIRLG